MVDKVQRDLQPAGQIEALLDSVVTQRRGDRHACDTLMSMDDHGWPTCDVATPRRSNGS
jgi:hypothetical protein